MTEDEDLGSYRMRTGAWVGLMPAVLALASVVYLYLEADPPLSYKSGMALVVAAVSVAFFAVAVWAFSYIVIKDAHSLGLVLTAIIASAGGAMFQAVWAPQVFDSFMESSRSPVSVGLVLAVISGLLAALVGVLQMEEVKGRGIGCLCMIGVIILGILVYFIT